MSRRLTRGFTLIEILMVISIIALLVSVLIPAVSQARVAFDTSRCMNNMRQIGLAMAGYANDFQSLAANANDFPSTDPTLAGQDLRWLYIVNKSTITSANPNGTATTAYTPVNNQQVMGLLVKYMESNRAAFLCPTSSGQSGVGDQVVLHYAIPTIISGLPLEQVANCYYEAADGTQKKLPGVPLIVEPEVFVNTDGTVTNNSLGVFSGSTSSGGKWTTLPNGAFESPAQGNLGDPPLTATSMCRHAGKILMGGINNAWAINATDLGSTELKASKIHIRLSSGRVIDLEGPNNKWQDWFNNSSHP